jgi:hypothetical protein
VIRRLGLGALVAGACSVCWVAPLLVGAAGAGWLEGLEVGLPLAIGGGALAIAALVLHAAAVGLALALLRAAAPSGDGHVVGEEAA